MTSCNQRNLQIEILFLASGTWSKGAAWTVRAFGAGCFCRWQHWCLWAFYYISKWIEKVASSRLPYPIVTGCPLWSQVMFLSLPIASQYNSETNNGSLPYQRSCCNKWKKFKIYNVSNIIAQVSGLSRKLFGCWSSWAFDIAYW